MKKNFIFLLFLIAFIGLNSCSNEESSIKGTTWSDNENGIDKTFRFDFSTCTYTLSSSALGLQITSSYTYVLDFPKVYMDAQSTDDADLEGTITNNNMLVKNTSTNKSMGIFTKQE